MKKRYNEKFVSFIEAQCQKSGNFSLVNEEFYNGFLSLTNEQMVFLVSLILGQIADVFNEKLTSGAWDSDDEMYAYIMLFIELVAEGKLVFNPNTGKMGFSKPSGDPPSRETWRRIQEKIDSSPPQIREAIIRNVLKLDRSESSGPE